MINVDKKINEKYSQYISLMSDLGEKSLEFRDEESSKNIEEFCFDVPKNRESIRSIIITGEGKNGSSSADDASSCIRKFLKNNGYSTVFSFYNKTTDFRSYISDEISISALITGDRKNAYADGLLVKAIKRANKGIKTAYFIYELSENKEIQDKLLYFIEDSRVYIPKIKSATLTEEGKNNFLLVISKSDKSYIPTALLKNSLTLKVYNKEEQNQLQFIKK